MATQSSSVIDPTYADMQHMATRTYGTIRIERNDDAMAVVRSFYKEHTRGKQPLVRLMMLQESSVAKTNIQVLYRAKAHDPSRFASYEEMKARRDRKRAPKPIDAPSAAPSSA